MTDHDAAPDPQLAARGLISTRDLAEHYGITEASVRKLMSAHGITEVRGYPAEAALGIQRRGRQPGPGRGHRRQPVDPE